MSGNIAEISSHGNEVEPISQFSTPCKCIIWHLSKPQLGSTVDILLDGSIESSSLEDLVTHDKEDVDLMSGSQVIKLGPLESLSDVIQLRVRVFLLLEEVSGEKKIHIITEEVSRKTIQSLLSYGVLQQ